MDYDPEYRESLAGSNWDEMECRMSSFSLLFFVAAGFQGMYCKRFAFYVIVYMCCNS